MNLFKNLLFLDIETISSVSAFDKLSETMQALWVKKASLLKKDQAISDEELYFDKAAIYAEFGQIICISIGFLYYDENQDLKVRIKAIALDNEKQLLEEFVSLLANNMDEKEVMLVGHNAKEFDFPYIGRRMVVNRIALPPYLDLVGKKPWEVRHIDTMEMWKFGDRKSFTSLALLTELLGISSPKEDISGADVNRVYYHEKGLHRIAHYCNRDVLATIQIYLRIRGIDAITEDDVCFVE